MTLYGLVMKVLLIASPSCEHVRRIESVASLVNACQRHYRLEVVLDRALEKTHDELAPARIISSYERNYPERNIILITEDKFDDDWFSHEYRSSAIITTFDWEAVYAPPSLRAYLIYEVAQALINFSAEISEEILLNMVHEPPEGCIFDMVVFKNNIKLGMVAGNICPKCISQIRLLGTPNSAIEAVTKIVSLVRAEALGRPVVLDPTEIFAVMRFSSNDENDHAWKYGLKPGIKFVAFGQLAEMITSSRDTLWIR